MPPESLELVTERFATQTALAQERVSVNKRKPEHHPPSTELGPHQLALIAHKSLTFSHKTSSQISQLSHTLTDATQIFHNLSQISHKSFTTSTNYHRYNTNLSQSLTDLS